jgi:hypothetical protein
MPGGAGSAALVIATFDNLSALTLRPLRLRGELFRPHFYRRGAEDAELMQRTHADTNTPGVAYARRSH